MAVLMHTRIKRIRHASESIRKTASFEIFVSLWRISIHINKILCLVKKGIPVSIATDAYLPPYKDTSWLPFIDQSLQGPDFLMLIATPSMVLMKQNGYDENDILALITSKPAELIGKGKQYGGLQPGMDASFIVSNGVTGLEITDEENIKCVFYKGVKVIDRGNS